MDSNTVIGFGIRAFWWDRAFALLQIVSAAALLLNYLNQQQRVQLQAWAAAKAQAASETRVPRLLRFRDAAKWTFPIVSVMAAAIAIFIMNVSGAATFPTFFRLFLLFLFFLSLLAIPIISLVFGATTIIAIIRIGQRYVPPLFAWTIDTARFERSLAVLSFGLFLIASFGQLYLS